MTQGKWSRPKSEEANINNKVIQWSLKYARDMDTSLDLHAPGKFFNI